MKKPEFIQVGSKKVATMKLGTTPKHCATGRI